MGGSCKAAARFGSFSVGTWRVERCIDATVTGASLAHRVRVGVWGVTQGTGNPTSHAVKPALVAVTAGSIAGERVTAGVTGIVCLTLRESRRKSDKYTRAKWNNFLVALMMRMTSYLRVAVWRVLPCNVLSSLSSRSWAHWHTSWWSRNMPHGLCPTQKHKRSKVQFTLIQKTVYMHFKSFKLKQELIFLKCYI